MMDLTEYGRASLDFASGTEVVNISFPKPMTSRCVILQSPSGSDIINWDDEICSPNNLEDTALEHVTLENHCGTAESPLQIYPQMKLGYVCKVESKQINASSLLVSSHTSREVDSPFCLRNYCSR